MEKSMEGEIARSAERDVPFDELASDIERLERRFRESAEEMRTLRTRFRFAERARAEVKAEVAEIRDEWEDVHYKWWVGVVALLVAFLLGSYLFYMNLGWYADQRSLPLSSDWLLDRLPSLNLIPLMSWGWLTLHLYAVGTAVLYYPRKMPFLLFLFGVYLCVRTVFLFLSPIGAPERMLDMSQLDFLFAQVVGVYTFQNEFIFSGHTSIPFLFALFFETRVQKGIMFVGSLVMASAVLLTHNHYTIDVLYAYFMSYAIYVFSRRLYFWYVRPLFLVRRMS
jgi:hypothetical protein